MCVTVYVRETEREREMKKVAYTVQRTATSAVNDAASKRRQTNREDTTLMS